MAPGTPTTEVRRTQPTSSAHLAKVAGNYVVNILSEYITGALDFIRNSLLSDPTTRVEIRPASVPASLNPQNIQTHTVSTNEKENAIALAKKAAAGAVSCVILPTGPLGLLFTLVTLTATPQTRALYAAAREALSEQKEIAA